MAYLAGCGIRDITPPLGTPLAGRPATYPSHTIHDPLKVRAFYLAKDNTAVILISVDLLLIERPESDPIRQAVAECLALPLDAIVLCCTHTHTGPAVGDWSPWNEREAYEEQLKELIIQAASEAKADAQPAEISFASCMCEGLSHNRRYVMSDGRVLTHPPKEGARHPDGPTDPEVQAIQIKSITGHPIATIVGFACHPTSMGFKENAISADFPYWIERTIQKETNLATPVLFFPGALGDQSDGDPLIRHEQVGIALSKRMGETIAHSVLDALEQQGIPIEGPLTMSVTDVSVPTIDMGPKRQAWARKVLKTPDGFYDTDVRDAKMILDMCAKWPDQMATQIPFVSIGDLALYGIPGELFGWYGMQLKSRSRFPHAMVLGQANDRIGYIADRVFPTKDIFNKPLDFAHRPFGKTGDAGEILVQAALAL